MMDIDKIASALAAFSARVHAAEKQRDLRSRMAAIGKTCGDCALWMTDRCPRERHNGLTGRKSGPSCNAPACSAFIISRSAMELKEDLGRQLNALSAADPQPEQPSQPKGGAP